MGRIDNIKVITEKAIAEIPKWVKKNQSRIYSGIGGVGIGAAWTYMATRKENDRAYNKGFEDASRLYEEKFKIQTEEFLSQVKDFERDKKEYEMLITEYEKEIVRLETIVNKTKEEVDDLRVLTNKKRELLNLKTAV